MTYEHKRDKLKKALRNNRPKVNRKKFLKHKLTKLEDTYEINTYLQEGNINEND